MITQYIVRLDNNYMNSFANIKDAKEFVEELERHFKGHKIEIESMVLYE